MSVSLYNSWSSNKFFFRDPLTRNYAWTLSMDMTVPILNWQSTRALIDEAAAVAEQARFTLEARRQTATQELVAARISVQQAALQLELARKGLAAAEDDYVFSRERFRVGAGTSLELQDAQLGLSRARVSQIDALVQAKVAEASLAHAEGRSILPAEMDGGSGR